MSWRSSPLACAGALSGAVALLGAAAPDRAPASGESVQAARVELGRRLFYDADLSINGTMSCATCHEQRHAFADGNATHPGALDDPGRRNVPGLANVGAFRFLTWADPREDSLETQIDVPMLGTHPVEMAMAGQIGEIAKRLGRESCYRAMFQAAFPGENAAPSYRFSVRAIAAFERTLVSRATPWDLWKSGDHHALTARALKGSVVFQNRCASCHAGPDFTDFSFHDIGTGNEADEGLRDVTGEPDDRGRFRTAPLRNVSLTAPYLHDGSAADLGSAIRAHAGFAQIDPVELLQLEAFLGALTDAAFVANPAFSLPDKACGKAL